MRNYIMIYENGIRVFELKNNKFRELLHHESEKVLRAFNNIENINEKDDETLELITDIKTDYPKRLIVRGTKLFNAKNDPLFNYVENLGLVIDRYMERKREQEIRDTLMAKNAKINRTRKKSGLKKQIVSIGLLASISIGIMSLKSCKEKEIEPSQEIEDIPSISMVENKERVKEVYYPFNDITDNGKLDKVINECSPFMDKWIERYNLPKDLIYALACQESGELNFEVRGQACGPMQIQPSSYHNDNAIEYIKVPVYKNGKLTEEYDEFYIADGRKLDDSRLKGKNYLVIQNEDDHFRIACAILRKCIDKYKNIFIAIDAYNKGIYALSSIIPKNELEYFKNDFNNFEWQEIIKSKFGENYGDKDYNDNVLRYLRTDAEGKARIEYDYKGEKIIIDLYNTRLYNNEITRG
ncbi:MAG: hypothetical protein E7163_02400 [Firmicutes bacterium]|nr:hypothetical protein [Bacillota bacterium]